MENVNPDTVPTDKGETVKPHHIHTLRHSSAFEKRAEGASCKEKEQVRYKREIVGA